MTLDEFRAKHPDLGFGVYALESGGPVTLEIHFGGDFLTWAGSTEADVLRQALVFFTPDPPPTLADVFG